MKRISIQLDDGAALSALTVGEGRPLIMIPGWSQTSAEWEGTVESLSLNLEILDDLLNLPDRGF